MFSAAVFYGILSLLVMCSSAFVDNSFGSIVVFVLGLVLLVAALCAGAELKYAHRVGQWPGR